MLGRIDVARGAIIGAMVGDAAGATLEFIGRAPKEQEVRRAMRMVGGGVWDTAPGQITDDGEMTLCLLHALGGRATYDRAVAARYYRRWLQSAPFDVGITTRKALNVPDYESDEELAEAMQKAASRLNMDSKANGSLMRLTPLGIWGHRVSATEAADAAKRDARLTHPNPACQHAAVAYVAAIRHLVLRPGDNDGAMNAAMEATNDEATGEVKTWLMEAEQDEGPSYYPQAGFVRIAFTHAFRHLKLRTAYGAAIKETLLGGGDTDTNACIVGGLMGALHGIEAIPEAMWHAVVNCNADAGRPRPEWLTTAKVDRLIRQVL